MSKRIDCIILAGGLSSRMKDWKPLMPFQQTTIVEASVQNALDGNCHVVLVTGYRGDELRKIFSENKQVTIVHNELYQQGMISSIQTGVCHVTTSSFFISHADMPQITPKIYRKLQCYQPNQIIFPNFKGKKGHPVLIQDKLKKAILQLNKGERLRPFLMQFPHTDIDIQSNGILIDIDTWDDYSKLIGHPTNS